MNYQENWTTAGNHARQEIQHKGTWTCPCNACVIVRASIQIGQAFGNCMECGKPCRSRKADFCSSACRQHAYRIRKQHGTAQLDRIRIPTSAN